MKQRTDRDETRIAAVRDVRYHEVRRLTSAIARSGFQGRRISLRRHLAGHNGDVTHFESRGRGNEERGIECDQLSVSWGRQVIAIDRPTRVNFLHESL